MRRRRTRGARRSRGRAEAGTDVFCTQCGQQNPDDSRFCARCGAAVAPAGPASGQVPGVETTSTIALGALEGALEEGTSEPGGPASGDQAEGPGSDESAGSTVDALPAGSALLVVKRGPNAGSRFLLDAATTTAGRHPESDIFLDDVTVSRRHAEFVRGDHGFLVRDVGSLNGTYLNRERIEAASLAGGDEVQIGKYRLVFLVGGGS